MIGWYSWWAEYVREIGHEVERYEQNAARAAAEHFDASGAERGAREATARIRGLIEAACERIRERTSDVVYGAFHGGDPREFSPDPECSTEAERAAHAADCASWARGEEVRCAPYHTPIDPERSIYGQTKGADVAVLEWDKEGQCIGGHVTKAAYGLGTYVVHDEMIGAEIRVLLAAIDADPPAPEAKRRGSHIPKTFHHDAGAYARCSYCGRYCDRASVLMNSRTACECGKVDGWSGSFEPPGPDAKWSPSDPASGGGAT